MAGLGTRPAQGPDAWSVDTPRPRGLLAPTARILSVGGRGSGGGGDHTARFEARRDGWLVVAAER